MTKLLLTLGLLAVLPCLIVSEDKCHLNNFQNCLLIAADWISSQNGNVPTTPEAIDVMCNSAKEMFSCMEKYVDVCMTPLHKSLISYALETKDIFNEQFCTPDGPVRKHFLEHANCINDAVHNPELKAVASYILASAEKFPQLPNDKKLLGLCCTYRYNYNYLFGTGEKLCGADAIKAFKEFMALLFAQVPDVLCPGFTGSEPECVDLLPPKGAKPSENAQQYAWYNLFYKVFGPYMDRRKRWAYINPRV